MNVKMNFKVFTNRDKHLLVVEGSVNDWLAPRIEFNITDTEGRSVRVPGGISLTLDEVNQVVNALSHFVRAANGEPKDLERARD